MEPVIAIAEGKSDEDKADHLEAGSSIKNYFMVKQEALGIMTKFDGGIWIATKLFDTFS